MREISRGEEFCRSVCKHFGTNDGSLAKLFPVLLTFPDIDECSAGHTCDSSATCHNSDGSYLCVCNSGYTGDGQTCQGMVFVNLLRLPTPSLSPKD